MHTTFVCGLLCIYVHTYIYEYIWKIWHCQPHNNAPCVLLFLPLPLPSPPSIVSDRIRLPPLLVLLLLVLLLRRCG